VEYNEVSFERSSVGSLVGSFLVGSVVVVRVFESILPEFEFLKEKLGYFKAKMS
jgi:hypothetical protein